MLNYVEAFEMRERYWRFVQNHPCERGIPPGTRRHVYDVLMWCKADQTLFSTSTSSFTPGQVKDLLDIIRELSDPATRLPDEAGMSYAFSVDVWFTAAVAATIGAYIRYSTHSVSPLNSPLSPIHPVADRIALGYGTPQARSLRNLEKRSEVADFSHPHFRSTPYMIFFALSFAFFFGIPTSCLRQIIDVDRRRFDGGGINETRWRRFLQLQLKGWSDSNLLSNRCIYAVPGIDNASRSITLLSALLSIGSVLMGQYHIRIQEPRSSSTAQTGLDYLQNVGSSPILAIFLSLPLIFISWSFVLFVVAFIIYALRGNDGNSISLPLSTKLIVTIAAGTLALLLAVIIFLFRAAWNPIQQPPLLPITMKDVLPGSSDAATQEARNTHMNPDIPPNAIDPSYTSTITGHFIPTSVHPFPSNVILDETSHATTLSAQFIRTNLPLIPQEDSYEEEIRRQVQWNREDETWTDTFPFGGLRPDDCEIVRYNLGDSLLEFMHQNPDSRTVQLRHTIPIRLEARSDIHIGLIHCSVAECYSFHVFDLLIGLFSRLKVPPPTSQTFTNAPTLKCTGRVR
ncbi:hypothetical protein SISSUDRAFT_1038593 [Sistotremastrum suecicum HHB10207 ss-3]|uniref:Uncharacterized protein n=1 Tax=Sistotremastrum suecicum HHB10207 ss-3 TaxID=1314776 RepID=A0A165WJE5_9AGAM|nr:hypothetical protein SISSUDRAFT_1038593 [Sistotremastrum suecicum HHB10207 ss-3]